MVFSGIPFLFFFLPVFLILYYIVPFEKNGVKWKNILLLIFSLIFYAWGEPIYILLMIFSSIVDYWNGRLINKYWHEPKIKLFLILSVIINLSLLGFFKYSDFIIQNINNLFSLNINPLNLGLPIGISFFTFQTMSYSIDVYRGKVHYERDFSTFMAYVSMFPQLIAGPIVRYEAVSEELHKRTINYENFNKGSVRFMKGLFKKVLLANNIGMLWSEISMLPASELTFIMSWLGIIAFALQIYFDFSGYSDMAIGLGKMLGFNYLENFNYPYIAQSITDFWRRWHISLSTFFRDYVYIPLGGSRVPKILNIRNILVVWALTGIWHGANWNFMLWGLYFGIILIIEKFIIKDWLNKQNKVVKHIYAITLILIGWAIFASSDILYSKEYLLSLIGIGVKRFIDSKTLYYISNYFIILVFGIIFSIPVVPYLENKIKEIKEEKKTKLLNILMALIYIILFIITTSYLVSDTYNPFLYFRF